MALQLPLIASATLKFGVPICIAALSWRAASKGHLPKTAETALDAVPNGWRLLRRSDSLAGSFRDSRSFRIRGAKLGFNVETTALFRLRMERSR